MLQQVYNATGTHIGTFDGEHVYNMTGKIILRVDGKEIYTVEIPCKYIGSYVRNEGRSQI